MERKRQGTRGRTRSATRPPPPNCVIAGPVGPFNIDLKAPAISCGSPDALWHATDVTIACTATDNGSGLQNSGDAGFNLSTNSFYEPPGTETDNGRTNSRLVCDNTAHCSLAEVTGIKIDKKAPVAAPAANSSPNGNGWYNTDVTFTWNWSDHGSGIDTTQCTTSSTTSGEGTAVSVSANCKDLVGNQGSSSAGPVKVDETDPTVTYTGNLGTYTPLQTVNITCTAADPLSNGVASGIDSSTCQNIYGPAYSFGPGKHDFSATASDKAGNEGGGATSFTVPSTVPSVDALITTICKKPGPAFVLRTLANMIATASNAYSKSNYLKAFTLLVQKPAFAGLTSTQAATLIAFAGAL